MSAFDLAQQRLPTSGIEREVEQGEGERPPRKLDEPAQHRELGRPLGRGVREIVEELEHALASAAHAARDRCQLFLPGGDGRRQGAVGRTMKE